MSYAAEDYVSALFSVIYFEPVIACFLSHIARNNVKIVIYATLYVFYGRPAEIVAYGNGIVDNADLAFSHGNTS